MKRRIIALGAALVWVGACSVINSPDALKPVDDGKAGDGTGGSVGTGATSNGGVNDAGAPLVQAGDTTGVGVGGCGFECSDGGAPPVGKACTLSGVDCGSGAPICDATDGACRACKSDAECHRDLGLDFCLTTGAGAGHCVACKTSASCSGNLPVCNNVGVCRACASDDECDSGVCEATGACTAPSAIVYALAETGVTTDTCGAIDTPCRFLAGATKQLTATKHTLVLLKTPKKFSDGAAFPAVKGLRVVGNGDTVHPFDGATAFHVPAGAGVTFDNVVIEGSTAEDQAGIECTGGSITVLNSTLQENAAGVLATDCDTTVVHSLIKHNGPTAVFKTAGIFATCTAEHCAKVTSFLRNRFVDNGVAISAGSMTTADIVNNVFLRNGYNNYTRVIELRADKTHFAYNTLVENFNNGIYVGIVACNAGVCTNTANISFNNFPSNPEYQDQVWYGGVMTYNLTEVQYPGATNKIGDPQFVDAPNGDFTPGLGSPAIDKGDPKDVPPLDLVGNPRPAGAAPDIGALESQ